MAFPTRLPKVGHGSEHFNERTWMCYHQTPPWERVVAYVGDAEQAKPHLEHNPLSLLGVCNATPMRKLNDPVPLATWLLLVHGVGARVTCIVPQSHGRLGVVCSPRGQKGKVALYTGLFLQS